MLLLLLVLLLLRLPEEVGFFYKLYNSASYTSYILHVIFTSFSCCGWCACLRFLTVGARGCFSLVMLLLASLLRPLFEESFCAFLAAAAAAAAHHGFECWLVCPT